MKHRAGFINIIGLPNVGKSTLLNAFLGMKTAIQSPKPQTTRHRLKAMINGEDYQLIFSDTPGWIENPSYRMQTDMNQFVKLAFEDADLLLFIITAFDKEPEKHSMLHLIQNNKQSYPILLVVNKVDLVDNELLDQLEKAWEKVYPFENILKISALNNKGIDGLMEEIMKHIPEHPPYFSKEEWTDRSERFFTSELIREKILELYHQEIPYSVEVQIESFKRGESKKGPIIRITANVFVDRKTQKGILIGKNGEMIKKLGTASRKSLESFFDENVFLEIFVKHRKGWRDDEQWLKNFGYEH